MDRVHFYTVILACWCMMVAMVAMVATMWGLVSPDVSRVYVLTFGLVAVVIMFAGIIIAKISDWKHSRATRRP